MFTKLNQKEKEIRWVNKAMRNQTTVTDTQWCNHNKCKWFETQVDHSEIVTLNQHK